MEQCNGISTPMSISVDNEDINDNYEYVDKQYYLKLVGLINYLAINTRPDLLYSLSQVAQRCTKPTSNDLKRVKRILRYISATKDIGLTYRCDNDFRLICHVDSSYNSYNDGKSHYGLTFSLGESNGSFYAKSQKSCICLSSTEAEYVAVSKASTEIIYLRRLLHSLGWSQSEPTIIYEDNQSCIKMLYQKELNHHTTKHINPKFHLTRQLIKNQELIIKYCPTGQMVADILTKPLGKAQHWNLLTFLLNYHD